MRTVVVFLAVLLGIFWLGCTYRINFPDRATYAQEPVNEAGQWRRTPQGWQHTSQWRMPAPPRSPRPPAAAYSLTIAGLQLLISGGALVAFSGRPRARHSRRAPICPQLHHHRTRHI